jgi:hypothetical protein
MSITINENFNRLLAELQRMGPDAQRSPTQDTRYQSFIKRFPAQQLTNLTLDGYCVGKGDGDSFSWWLERGLEPMLGRYSPGTSRGHVLYFAKNGSVYKHRHLMDLSDQDALNYTLKVHAAVASADLQTDLMWVDDDEQIYKRAGVEARTTIGDGRKLRLLAAYFPDQVIPISSSQHIAHFLKVLGCPPTQVPKLHQPVARMLVLMDYYKKAHEAVPGVTPQGFMRALYAPALGLAPLRDIDEVLAHFGAVPDLVARLETTGQTDVFCQLVLTLREADLDWWITEDKVIYAGRTDDPKLLQSMVALALECTSQGVHGRLYVSDIASDGWQMLDADQAARWVDASSVDDRVPHLVGREACWPDDYDGSDTTLTVMLSGGAVRNGYITVPKLQALFPKNYVAENEKTSSDTFQLLLPDGTQTDTCVLANRNRIKARFNGLFNQLGVKEGDRVVIQKKEDGCYRMLLNAQGAATAVSTSSIEPTLSTSPVPTMSVEPLNQILFGPPGTGKTYATIDRALAILDPALLVRHEGQNTPAVRAELKSRFDELKAANRVRFTTFHQSFSYEDFVEGIRAHADEVSEGTSGAQGVRYRVEPGVFMQLCLDARRDRQLESTAGIREGAKVWKLSIEEASSSGATRSYCFQNNEARIGWPQTGDLNKAALNDPALKLGPKDQQSLANFSQEITVGDVVVCLGSKTTISAVGVVTGDYEYESPVPAGVRDDYVHKLPVHWLATGLNFSIVALNGGKQLTLQAVYPLNRVVWPELLEALTAAKLPLTSLASATTVVKDPYVLIIDEINRGNVSRIFGELITLIEPSKRMGAPEALAVTLPYSKKPFFVPDNVYLIGTMNTADRSLAGLDVALRRRFDFKEMPPRPELLSGVTVESVSIQKLLETLNLRIEALLDREHVLGHAYFMPLKDAPKLAVLASIFRNKVLPLLQEYFFDDWQRIQWVLNDHRKTVKEHQFVQADRLNMSSLFGEDVTVSQQRSGWKINNDAFELIESYLGVIQAPTAA